MKDKASPRLGWMHAVKGRLIAALLVLVLSVNWTVQILAERTIYMQDAEARVSALARAGEYQVDGALRSIEALLDEAADRIDPKSWPNPSLREWFSTRLIGFPEIRNMVVVDAQGRAVDSSFGRPGKLLAGAGTDLSDRDYFQVLRDGFPHPKLAIGAPVISRFSGQASLPMARSIVTSDGAFGGIILLGVDPAAFRDKLSSVVIEDEGAAALLRRDGVFMARVPDHDKALGRAVPDSPLFRDLLPKAASGVGHYTAHADGNRKIVGYRTLENYGVVVTVGMTERTALARWHGQITNELVVLLVVAAALMALAWAYDRREAANFRLTAELAASRDALEAQVQERTAKLAATVSELEQFAYVASHDLQEPLRTVTSFLQLLARRYGGQLDEQADEYITFAVDGAKRMSALINDILVFSKVGADGPPEPCDSAEQAQIAVKALAGAVADAGAVIELGPLPKVICHPAQLRSVFQNLLGNAVKYRRADCAASVRVSAWPTDDGMVRFTVADNGIGIEPEYAEKVFGIFQRLHTIDRYEGTGIGLALCRKIIERHGGRIWVEPREGPGTTIIFTLPASPRPLAGEGGGA